MHTDQAKKILEAELAKVELELTDIGVLHATKHPFADTGKPPGWDAESQDTDTQADVDEEQEINKSLAATLEKRLEEIRDALEAISTGAYGTCITCGSAVEEERLEANPAARTCIACA